MFKLTRTQRKWDSMIGRCYRPSHPAFKYYGGRGVKVCDHWRHDCAAFLADMGEAPPGLWLDRIDNTKGYEPGNCRWVTPKESAANRAQRKPVPGSLPQRCLAAGLPFQLVYQRIRRGWPEAVALSAPVEPRGGMTYARRMELGL